MSASYVVSAVYRAKEGLQGHVAQILKEMALHARNEPGCLRYLIHRGSEDERTFLLYEEYRSLEAFERHKDSEPFDRIIKQEAWPALASREVAFWESLDT